VSRYQVWSTHVEFKGDVTRAPEKKDRVLPTTDVLEVSRTDFKVAQEDAAIFREIFHRKSWVIDTQEGRT
jgi:hypothetical protein